MAKQKEVEVVIDNDGNLSMDMQGFEGKECDGQLDALIKALGTATESKKKDEYYKQKVTVNRRH